ncbi:MAG: GAF domain-containing protein [Candidatus Zixiibacteriota bacterium]
MKKSDWHPEPSPRTGAGKDNTQSAKSLQPGDKLYNVLVSALSQSETDSELFLEYTRALQNQFNISQGVLVLVDPVDNKLAAVSTIHNGSLRDGLRIRLPAESSLFSQVVDQSSIYNEEFVDTFSGNFFERKLLLDEDSRSFVLQPLKHDARVVGLVGFSSQQPAAFAMFEEGDIDRAAELLAKYLALRHQPQSPVEA